MKNYFTYVLCLLAVFSIVACKQASNSGSQTIEKQETERKTAHQPQTTPEVLTDDADVIGIETDVIEQIRANYAVTMERLSKESLKKVTKEFDCEDEGVSGTLTRYYNGDKIELIDYSIGHEHSWKSQKIYFKDDEPYFIFVEEGTWYFGGEDGTDDSGENTVDDISETRYYLEDGNVIRKLNKKYLIKSWEAKPKINEIPNETVTDDLGKSYPDMQWLPTLLKGEIGC